MNISVKYLQNELLILRGRYTRLAALMFYGALLVYMDYFIITEFDTILGYLSLFKIENLFDTPMSIVMLCLAIFLRPIFSWVGTAYSVYASQKILREIEHDIKIRFFNNRGLHAGEFDVEEISNVYITYGRWFIDAFLLPCIRAILDLAILLTITAGLVKKFPVECLIFSLSCLGSLTLYNLATKSILRSNGKTFLQSPERLMKLSQVLFQQDLKAQNIETAETAFDQTLDQKMKSGTILGMLSQGLKNVVELVAMFSFGATLAYVLLTASSSIAIFSSTFVYAIFRILPSINVLISFYQQRNNARFAIDRLAKIFEN